MASIFQRLLAEGEGDSSKPYLIIPMTRLLDNSAVLSNNTLPSTTEDPLEGEYSGPDAPEEPQIGFRFDSPSEARYQEAMRYGRRSKLELLWRLGAIPFSRKLHEKKVAWEKLDLQYITAESHGSLMRRSQDGKVREAAYVEQAGWVHRLFSGKREQEESSVAAGELRRMNRMKGIIAYLEGLDERVSRGEGGCLDIEAECGFRKTHLWTWEGAALAQLKRDSKSDKEGSTAFLRLRAFEDRSKGLYMRSQTQLSEHAGDEEYWRRAGPVDIARTAARLALVGYLTSNASYSQVAAELVKARFLDLHSHHHQETLSEHLLDEHTYAGLDTVSSHASSSDTEIISGYAFPPFLDSKKHLWQTCHPPVDAQDFPYDALHIDLSLLLDALRLLGPAYQPDLHIDTILPPQAIRSLLSRQLAGLLLSTEGREISANPSSKIQAARHDATVASLAAYLDDVKLLGRVISRHRVRYADHKTGTMETVGDEDGRAAKEIRETMLRAAKNAGWPVNDADIDWTATVKLDPVFHL